MVFAVLLLTNTSASAWLDDWCMCGQSEYVGVWSGTAVTQRFHGNIQGVRRGHAHAAA